MSTADLAFGLIVLYADELAEIIDICWRVDRTSVQIRLLVGQRRRLWVRPSELKEAP